MSPYIFPEQLIPKRRLLYSIWVHVGCLALGAFGGIGLVKITPMFQKSNHEVALLLNPLKEEQIGALLGRGLREGHVRVVGDDPLPALPLALVDQGTANAVP